MFYNNVCNTYHIRLCEAISDPYRLRQAIYVIFRYRMRSKALEIDPNDADAWNNKGNALYNLGNYNEAIECYNQTLKIDPNYINAWYNKGVVLGKL